MKIGDKVMVKFGFYRGQTGKITGMDSEPADIATIHIFVEMAKGTGCYAKNELRLSK